MDYMFETGFLGTRAPFFMDFVMIMVAILPILVALAISFAKNKNYKLHGITQSIIFLIAIVVVGYFEYGVRAGGGYEGFVEGSSVSRQYAFYVLIFHIMVATIGFFIWTHTLISARIDSKKGLLVGKNSKVHKKR